MVGSGGVVGGVVGSGGSVGEGSVVGGIGVIVGTVCRKGLCPGAAHSSGPVVSPTIDVASSASSSMPMFRLIMPSVGSIVPCPVGVSRLECISIGQPSRYSYVTSSIISVSSCKSKVRTLSLVDCGSGAARSRSAPGGRAIVSETGTLSAPACFWISSV